MGTPAGPLGGPRGALAHRLLAENHKKLASDGDCGIFRRSANQSRRRDSLPRPSIVLADPQLRPCPGMRAATDRYYKRFQMEVDLRRWRRPPLSVRPSYRFVTWSPDLVEDHAEVKYLSFRDELDAVVFPCLGDLDSCHRLMTEISDREGFVPEATWLALYAPPGARHEEPCGTIQAIRVPRNRANIQNIGVTPHHRGGGVGAALIAASLSGLQQVGVTRVSLEVTAANDVAVHLYRRLGFRVVKTLYKAHDEPLPEFPSLAR
jgi:ribosomal protein S18 acetylase RimI-like enzyme